MEARRFFDDFITELGTKAAEVEPTMSATLEDVINRLRCQNPAQAYSHLIKCMAFEKDLLNQTRFRETCQVSQVSQAIQELTNQVQVNEKLKTDWIRRNNSARFEYNELSQRNMEHDYDGRENQTREIARQLQMSSLDMQLDLLRVDFHVLVDSSRKIVESAKILVNEVVDNFIKQWKWNRKFCANNFVLTGVTLDTVQDWCERLIDSIWRTREQIKLIKSYQNVNGYQLTSDIFEQLHRLNTSATAIILKLINGSFVVERQPCTSKNQTQVLRKEIKFSTSVRLLIGEALGFSVVKPLVKFHIISELQARQIAGTNIFSGSSICQVENDCCNFEFNDITRQLVGSFCSSKITTIFRPDKRKEVADEKFALWFQSSFTIGDLQVNIQTMSLPIALIVHVNQDARPSIFWDNSFSLIERLPFDVPDQVAWRQFSTALDQIFAAETGRGLTTENLHFLAEKIFNRNVFFPVPDDLIVSWVMFTKKNLPGRNFTFWQWFYRTLRLTGDYLRGLWQAGIISGFIDKPSVEGQLKNCSDGTFMLRFSDSELGEKESEIFSLKIII